jgi:hypothetical protein
LGGLIYREGALKRLYSAVIMLNKSNHHAGSEEFICLVIENLRQRQQGKLSMHALNITICEVRSTIIGLTKLDKEIPKSTNLVETRVRYVKK